VEYAAVVVIVVAEAEEEETVAGGEEGVEVGVDTPGAPGCTLLKLTAEQMPPTTTMGVVRHLAGVAG